MKYRRWTAGAALVCALSACDGEAGPQTLEEAIAQTPVRTNDAGAPAAVCTPVGDAVGLPDEVRETSGLAQSRRDPTRFWTHNDAGNAADLYALDAAGQLVQRVRVAGVEAADWEDIESGPCESGNCLFIGDIGDNDAERDHITVYRIPEPVAGATESAAPEAMHARYPDGRPDAESLFRLPTGEMFVVTKGRRGPIALYRFPPSTGGATVTLERVRDLFPEPQSEDDRVTAATSSPDGQWVGVRTYRNLYLYRADALTGAGEVRPSVVDLRPLGHGQGESLVISDDGTVWMTSEAENKQSRPLLGRLRCTLPEG